LVVNLEKDPETGELILPIPADLLSQMGWIEGTELFWIDNEDGTYSLKEKKNGTSEEQRPDSDDAVSVIRLSEPTVRSD
jgi:phosphatidylserine decarboxylase